jgi:electron transfer flavoprotein alpha subunit
VSELVASAAKLGRPVVAVVVGPESVAKAVAAPGVDKVLWVSEAAGQAAEAFAPAVADLVAADPGVVFAGRKPAERVLLGAVAARLGAPVVAGATAVAAEGGTTVVTHGTYGGIAVATVAYDGPVVLVGDGGGALAGGGTAAIEAVAATPGPISVVSLAPSTVEAVDLAGAARVVSVGRGLKSADDLPLLAGLAKALGAELGCSRPVAESLEWLPKDHYVGISGQHIAPDFYLMVGISGQIQHMGGCRGAKLIVCINTDKDAPVMHQADYVLQGDLYDLVPAITAAV